MPLNILQQQQPLAVVTPSTTATMATTTYSFTYTTFTNTSPQPFTKPTIMPTGIFSFAPVQSCSANSAAPTARPSGAPVDVVQGSKAGCAISNAMEDSNHAFWDLYECCSSHNITGIGKPLPCSAQCLVGDNQTWQDLGSCLSKRNAIVVCKPDNSEIASGAPSAAPSASASKSAAPASSGGAGTSAGGAASATTGGSGGAAKSSVATAGASSSVEVMQASFSKAGVFVFALVAVTSAAGMFL